ncbi:MAG TPA: ABC-three component system protein [Terriglobales bacterium]|nr:ABC-three component system protein [Terriglobales bacterium]
MKRHYRLHELEDTEFEDLVCRICMRILGMGTISFSSGKDGGRDARFDGTAQHFPSKTNPARGKFVVQAKHTTQPGASCSDSPFKRVFKDELPKIKNLAKAGDLELYLLFTNRDLTGGTELSLVTRLRKIRGVREAWVLGNDPIRQHLDMHPEVWSSMGLDRYEGPFRVSPDEMVEVVTEFHKAVTDGGSSFNSALNFNFVGKDRKNKINRLSKSYYAYIQHDSLPHFRRIKAFLEDPRNVRLKALYHDTADELRQKIVTFRGEFGSFDEVLTHVRDLIATRESKLAGKKRLVNLFLHYMYCNCDIGDHAKAN